MMNSFLGEDVFRSGVSNYLKKFSYSNSEQDDLWASLTAAAEGRQVLPAGGVTVKDIMDTWTLQSGYPVIKVQREGGRLTASQVFTSSIINNRAFNFFSNSCCCHSSFRIKSTGNID